VAPVALGTAGTYSALGRTNVVNSLGPTILSGDLGVIPGPLPGALPGTIAGFSADLATVHGTTHINDPAAVQAQADLLTAYNDADGRTPTTEFTGDRNGQTFTPGVHHTAAAFALTGILTLDGLGDPNAVFIFQVDAALDTAASSSVLLTNGTQASRVFWQVLGAAGTGASSTFAGTIMAEGAITVGNLAVLQGAALSRGVITLSANTITTPVVTDGLSITVPGGAVSLGSRPNTLGGGVISGPLGVVQVNDARNPGAGSGWVASVSCTAFNGPGDAIPASAVSYSAGTITKMGTATYVSNDPGNLSGVAAAVTATAITGNNTATWTPTISVTIPGSTVSGTYTATITHSVL
jgi:hypothetical protein